MALAKTRAICRSCNKRFKRRPTRTFLGFQALLCPRCSARVLYPLTSGYRAFYWAYLAVVAVATIAVLVSGKIPIPGLFAVPVVWALLEDGRIKREVLAAESGVTVRANDRAPIDASNERGFVDEATKQELDRDWLAAGACGWCGSTNVKDLDDTRLCANCRRTSAIPG